MPELTLDHEQRDTLAGHLDRMRMPQLVGREPAANPCRQRGDSQLAAHPGWRESPANGADQRNPRVIRIP